MLVQFDHFYWVLCAAALLVAGAGAVLVCRRQSRRWRLAGIVLPGAAAVCVALALSGLAIAVPGQIAIVLDFSPSARTALWHDPEWVRQLALRRLPSGERLAVLADDGIQRRIVLPQITPESTWPASFDWEKAPPADAGSRAAQWLITDGLFAAPEKRPAAATVVRPGTIDVGIRDLIARQAGGAEGGQAVEILAQVRAVAWPAAGSAAASGSASIKLERDGAVIGTVTKEFAAAPGQPLNASSWVTFRDLIPAKTARGPHRYTTVVMLMPQGDAWPENDSGSVIWVGSGGGPRVLTVSNRRAESPGVVRPERFFRDASQLAAEGWQAIVLDDIPALALSGADGEAKIQAMPAAGAEAIGRFVRETGGGLLIAAHGSAFGPGHYGEGMGAPEILENLSPVWSRPHDSSGSSIIFILDASASMNEAVGGERKFSLLSRAVTDATGFLADGDGVALITFNHQAQLVAQGKARETAAKLPEKLAAIQPQGETAPDAALEMLAGVLKSADFHSPLVVFLTDGDIPSLDVARWKQTLGSTPLVIVAPRTATVASSPLEQLAASGINARWQPAADPAAWRGLLSQLVLEPRRGTVRHEPLAWRAGGLAGRAASWTQTWLKPESQLIAQGPRGEPAAAAVQRGLGQVAALTIPDDSSAAHTAIENQLLERILAPDGDRRFHAATERQSDGTWLLTADGIDGDAFLDHQSLSVRILSAEGKDAITPLTQTAPGHYEVRISAAHGLTAVITRQAAGGDQLVARVQTADVQIKEFPASVDALWSPAANAVNGMALLSADPRDATPWDIPTTPIALAPSLWLIAAFLAVAALWLRK